MKFKTLLLTICMLSAAGATGTAEHVMQTRAVNTTIDAGTMAKGASVQTGKDESWLYKSTSNYVAPKEPI